MSTFVPLAMALRFFFVENMFKKFEMRDVKTNQALTQQLIRLKKKISLKKQKSTLLIAFHINQCNAP